MTQAIIQTNIDELLADCGTIDAVSWQAPKQMTFAQWAEIGSKFQHINGSLNWWLGDWLNEGEKRYGETYTQAIELTGNSLENLKTYKSIALSVKRLTRINLLSWTHHRYVAHLPDAEQRLWLEHAQEHQLSSRQLKQALEQANANRKPLPQPDLNWMPEEPKLMPLPSIYTNGNGASHQPVDNTYEQMADDLAGDESGYDWTEDEPKDTKDCYSCIFFQAHAEDGWCSALGRPLNADDPLMLCEGRSWQAEEKTIVVNASKPHVAQNSGNNEWYTPAEYIEAARNVLGAIDLDPASNPIANEVVKASTYYTVDDDGLAKTWTGRVWLNPPYAKDTIDRFAKKLRDHCLAKDVCEAIVLVNNATETEWFQHIISVASSVVFPRSRIRFYRPDGELGAPLQGQAIIYIGSNVQLFRDTFSQFGWSAVL